MEQDTVIIGGGIAGLSLAERLANAGHSVLVLEKYKSWGGRIATERVPAIGAVPALQYEVGAGRIPVAHPLIGALVKKYKLHTYPITTNSKFEEDPNPFLDLLAPIREALEQLSPEELGSHTLGELVPKELHPLFDMYPYDAEIHMLRADLALPLFKPKGLMGTRADDAYYGIKEGLDTITTRIHDAAKKAGADLRSHHDVDDATRREDGLFDIKGTHEEKPFHFVAKRLVIATCRCSLSGFSVLKGTPLLQQLSTAPLTRIYAVYPKSKTTGEVWFKGMEKIITTNPLRHVIPINPESGLIMISYTDGKDTKYWKGKDGPELEKDIQAAAKELFPEKDIPTPIYLKRHSWGMGCTYWTPGSYKVEEASRAAHNPSENVFVVGESVSQTQAWIEGALESVETLWSLPAFKKKVR
jgi:hypothetical protein